MRLTLASSRRGFRCAAPTRLMRGRVCRAWHGANRVKAPMPGRSGAEGEEQGKGVTARWGLEAAQSKEAGRRTGTG
jgi:hypothetical protein